MLRHSRNQCLHLFSLPSILTPLQITSSSVSINTINMIKILKFTSPAWIYLLNFRLNNLTAKLTSLPLSVTGTSNLTCPERNSWSFPQLSFLLLSSPTRSCSRQLSPYSCSSPKPCNQLRSLSLCLSLPLLCLYLSLSFFVSLIIMLRFSLISTFRVYQDSDDF